MAEKKLYTSADIKHLPDSQVEISVVIPFENLAPFREKALNHLKDEMTLPGFRKGHVPEKMMLEKLGELGILEEAAELLIKEAYPDIIVDNNLDLIGQPQIAITKLATNNPLEFKILGNRFPEFSLPDYKKIAKEVLSNTEKILVLEKDIEEVVSQIRKMKAVKEESEEKLPELTDDFVKTVGEFETVADFKSKIKENLEKEKEFRDKEKQRLQIIEKIIEKANIEVPPVLVQSELDRMFSEFSSDIKQMGQTVTEYLARIKKTEADLRKEWQKDAISRVKFELVLDKIGSTEKIKASEEDIKKEVDHIVEHYSGAVPERVRTYVEHRLQNEEVFKFLEAQK